VTITVAFNDTGPRPLSITPYAWRLYGDGTNGAVAVDTGSPASLRSQVVEPGGHASGLVTFEVSEDVYQLITVGKLPESPWVRWRLRGVHNTARRLSAPSHLQIELPAG
jgi:hypothetical protein